VYNERDAIEKRKIGSLKFLRRSKNKKWITLRRLYCRVKFS